jgi:hypothetical protein
MIAARSSAVLFEVSDSHRGRLIVDGQRHSLVCPPLYRLCEPLHLQDPRPDARRSLAGDTHVDVPVETIDAGFGISVYSHVDQVAVGQTH